MKRTILILVSLLLASGVVFAGEFEDGLAAYNRGDYATAISKFTKAVEQGNANAQYKLGVMYAYGEGGPKDDVQAYMWWNLAAAQGIEDARTFLGKVEKQMPSEKIDEAQRLSREWKPR